MITYAQNFEDVILARAFGDRRRGFYIDIGACFPDEASVTRHFYERGWSGINVEPMEEPFLRLSRDRVRDLNLRAAIADHCGEIAIFPGASVGESSAVRTDPGVQPVTVPCLTLAELCRRHVQGPIDFLKVDVEGLELQVVRGGEWRSWRPKVVVIEISEPWSSKRRSDAPEIARLLDDAGYSEVYFDGLNAFFLANEASSLGALLACPPNVLDHFQTAREARFDAVSEAASASEARAAEQARRSEGLELRLQEAIAGWRAVESGADLRAVRMDELASKIVAIDAKVEAVAARITGVDAALHRVESQGVEMKSELATANRWAESAVDGLVRRLGHAESRAVTAETQVVAGAAQVLAAEARARAAETSYAAIERSRSWRWMAPVREIRAAISAIVSGRAFVGGFRAIRRWLAENTFRAALRVRRSPACEPAVRVLRRRFPGTWLRAKAAFRRLAADAHANAGATAPRSLNASTPVPATSERRHDPVPGETVAASEPQALTASALADMIRLEAARNRSS